jgi:hypothetical protein
MGANESASARTLHCNTSPREYSKGFIKSKGTGEEIYRMTIQGHQAYWGTSDNEGLPEGIDSRGVTI